MIAAGKHNSPPLVKIEIENLVSFLHMKLVSLNLIVYETN